MSMNIDYYYTWLKFYLFKKLCYFLDWNQFNAENFLWFLSFM